MEITRREWMTAAALAASVASGIGVATTASAELQEVRLDPLHYKLSIAAYSLRKYLPQDGKPGTMTMEQFIARAFEWRFDAVEPTSYYFESENMDYVHGLRSQAHWLGLDVSGTAIRNDFCHPDAEQRKKEMAHVKKWVEIALHLGAPCIRVFAGNEHKGQNETAARALVVAGLKEACDYAGQSGVFLAIENHGYLTGTAEELLNFIEEVNHPWLGINLDTGNFKTDPYGNMAKAAARSVVDPNSPHRCPVVNVQFKTDVISADGRSREPADFARIFQILYDAKYRGYVALEYEGADDPLSSGIPKFLASVRDGMAAADKTRPEVIRGAIRGLHEWSVRPALPEPEKG